MRDVVEIALRQMQIARPFAFAEYAAVDGETSAEASEAMGQAMGL